MERFSVFHILLVEDWNVESQHERPRLKLQISTLSLDWELLSFPAINFGVWACGLDDFLCLLMFFNILYCS